MWDGTILLTWNAESCILNYQKGRLRKSNEISRQARTSSAERAGLRAGPRLGRPAHRRPGSGAQSGGAYGAMGHAAIGLAGRSNGARCIQSVRVSEAWNFSDRGLRSAADTIVKLPGRTERCCGSRPRRRRSGDRDRAGDLLSSVDLQRPGAGPLRARREDRIRVNFLNQGSHPHTFTSTAGIRRDGRLAARTSGARRAVRLSSTPSRSACTSITATRCR